MLKRIIARREDGTEEKDQGFTLIELLVVIVIVGILAAIAIPIFLNQRQKAVDSGIESDLKALATIEETLYTDTQAYSSTKTELEDEGFKASEGNKIEVAVSPDGYCIKGENDAGSDDKFFIYDSNDGGLKVTDALVECSITDIGSYTDVTAAASGGGGGE
ncbi:prepilin-type N-terminal cleavage/methylation domain-containing protein [Nocardioides sp. BGMRC 2183]|nr:prepilin-type N-terminal cleavage/methylation domain-containing protein [Nocardioides sp. BGMRC 2183]